VMEVVMSLDKETKGAVRYAEQGNVDKQMLRTIYVRKTAFEGDAPKEVTVKVEW